MQRYNSSVIGKKSSVGPVSASGIFSVNNISDEQRNSNWPSLVSYFLLSNITYDNINFSLTSQDSDPIDVYLNTNGTKMYILGRTNDKVFQYSLSTAFDVSTASYDNVSVGNIQEPSGRAIEFNPSGTKMYVLGTTNDKVFQFSLSTAFDLSTASYDDKNIEISSQETAPQSCRFNTTGTKLFVLGNGNDSVFQYSLTTAFDVSTASYDNVSFSVSSQDMSPRGFSFNEDGRRMYIVGSSTDKLYQYSLTTAFDLSTASYDNLNISLSSQDSFPSGIFFNTTYSKMYILGSTSDKVYQYSTGL